MTELTGAQVRSLRVLHAIWRGANGRANENVSSDTVHANLSAPVPLDVDLDAELRILKSRSLVDYWAGGAGIGAAFLTPEGRNLAEEFDAQRRSLPHRRRQLREDYLSWLYNEIEGHDRRPTPDGFLATSPSYLGEPYSESDVQKVGAWLRDHGFITGQGAWQYDAPLHPQLTAKGSWVIETGRSPNDPPPSTSAQYTTVVHGDANVANASTAVSQQLATSGGWIADAKTLLDSVDQAMPALRDADEVSKLIAEARAEIEVKNPEPGRVKKALSKLGDFLGRSGSGALGGVLAKQISDLIGSLL